MKDGETKDSGTHDLHRVSLYLCFNVHINEYRQKRTRGTVKFVVHHQPRSIEKNENNKEDFFLFLSYN